MAHDSPSLEPLADYLEPQVGNLYDYNFVADDAGFEVQPWTPELRDAVTYYVVHKVSDEAYTAFLEELECDIPAGPRDKQANFITTHCQAWEIAHALHRAAVKAIPTLEQLTGNREQWAYANLQEDAADWLETHATDEQLQKMAKLTDYPEIDPRMPWYKPEPTGWDLAWHLTPPTLLHAWHQVTSQTTPDPADATPQPSQPDKVTPSGSQIRSWARARGHQIGQRGRLPKHIVQAYHQTRRGVPDQSTPSANQIRSWALSLSA